VENRIEEDIKIVENYLANSAINEIDSNFFKNSGWETVDLEIPKSMQHILSDYKRVLKENNRLEEQVEYDKTHIYTPQTIALNFILKKKIEDEIEELKGKLEDISRQREKSKTKEEETVLWCLEIRTDERIKTLQDYYKLQNKQKTVKFI
jgi:hypothetical protein